MKILIVGGGIAGFTLALLLHKKGFKPHVFEAAGEIRPLGLGINLLPHSTKVLDEIGVLPDMATQSIETKEASFYNRFGQHIYSEPLGLAAGYEQPQLSIHRADIQQPLIDAFLARAGADHFHLGHRCTSVEQDEDSATVHFENQEPGAQLPSWTGDAVISTEGIHSAIRRQFHPEEGDPVYSGVNMWRGVVVCKPFLSGATMTRVGWLSTGKMVIYPVRDNVDGKGSQLINWVAELETPDYKDKRDWNKPGRLEDFIGHFDDMAFNWLDIPDMIRRTESIFEFPMVDQDPLDRWTEGLVTLMGDAAHPMYPRGSNGAGQAIMDAKYLAEVLNLDSDPREVLKAYEVERLPATSKVVLTNRSTPPDAVLQVVFERTGDKPFDNIEDVVSRDELVAITSRYKQVAGYDLKQLKG